MPHISRSRTMARGLLVEATQAAKYHTRSEVTCQSGESLSKLVGLGFGDHFEDANIVQARGLRF